MNISEIWIRRPVMTILVMCGLLLFGILSYRLLPINNLPDVDFPTISVSAALPGADPETMAATVATPLEKKFSIISGVDSMTSTSTMGATVINIQFSLSRQIDAAALDVNSAIAAAMGVLPRNMPNPPTYKKVNPADMPIVLLALTSRTLPISVVNDFAENILAPRISQIDGVAEIDWLPSQKYAVRVQLNPNLLASRGIGINEVADALANGNVNLPGGSLDGPAITYTLEPYGQLTRAAAYNPLIVAYPHGSPVRIRDIGRAIDGIENDKGSAMLVRGSERLPALVLRIRKQVGANTTQTADRIKALLPDLRRSMPSAMNMDLTYDQSLYIRESIMDVQYTMIFTIFLVVAVVFLFIRAFKPTLIPSLVVPLSLVAVFPVMSLCGYTLNTLSLMALTLSIGFVVDDAIVVLENIIRRREAGESALEASLRGSREIGFTVLSMTVSLAIVFVPIMFMGGILGRLFREFAVCITAAILFSGLLSLTLTPMLASRFLDRFAENRRGWFYRSTEWVFEGMRRVYAACLRWTMRHRPVALVFTVAVTAAMVFIFQGLPKGFIPTQDQYFFRIFALASDRTPYTDMLRHQGVIVDILARDPDVAKGQFGSITGFSGDNSALVFVSLPPRSERQHSVDEIITRLRPQMAQVPGLAISLVNPPLISVGARLASAQWQFTLQSIDIDDLYRGGALLEKKMKLIPGLTDVKSDIQLRKPKLEIEIDRDKASSYGLTLKQIQDAFYSAYGERQVSTIYTSTNFYYVILELEPRFSLSPPALSQLYLKTSRDALVPLDAVARLKETVAPLSVSHSGQIPAATISFNLLPGQAIGPAVEAVDREARAVLPPTVRTSFQGTAQAFQASFASMGFLLILTVILIYLVLGILYESFLHPLTILTSLPLAGFGALAALWLLKMELDIYAYVGIIMLVGIVKKNGIMMVDFALETERTHGLSPEDSIIEACLIRFRPIMMTTLAALFGTLPIAAGIGAGGEARQSLGVAVVGGLLFSQFLTLFITPVFYVYLDKLSHWFSRRRSRPSIAERMSDADQPSTLGGQP